MKIIFIPILTLLFSFNALAQNANVNKKEKLTKISFKGLIHDIPEAVIIEKSGLKIGQMISEQDRYIALHNLEMTYLFRHLDMDSVSLNGNIQLTIIVEHAPAAKGPCVFQNFENIKKQELVEAIQKIIPDFKGEITRVDFILGKVTNALTQMLSAKNIDGKIIERATHDLMSDKPVFIFVLNNTQQ